MIWCFEIPHSFFLKSLELKEKKYDKSAQFLMNAFATPFFRLLTVGPKGVIV